MGEDRIGYVLKLARALHGYGYAAHRLEEVLGATAQRLGLEAQFFSTPTSIFAAFGPQEDQRTYLLRVEPGDTDLARLADVDRITLRVIRGELSVAEGSTAIENIASAAPIYSPPLTTLAFGVASACAAVFFGGGLPEVALAGTLGIVTGLLALSIPAVPALARIFEPLAALIATIIATGVAARLVPLSVPVTVLAGLIVFIPGLTLTVAMTELASRHLVSGTARISSALLLFVTIIFGVALGAKIGQLAFGTLPGVLPIALPAWAVLLALTLAPLAFVVLLRAHPSDAGWILAAGWLAFSGARIGAGLLGTELGAFAGAFAVGVAANLYALLRDRPSQVLLVPGVLLLVPGSVGFRSVSALVAREVVSGVETAFTMIFIATAIVAGLLLANVVVPKRRA
jgi:uncharacterized membrane protein YjjP (DUF1212 family)